MNLIEKLGLEKCKQIVEGAPDWANKFNPETNQYSKTVNVVFLGASYATHIVHSQVGFFGGLVSLNDLRTAIDHHYYGQSEQKELEQYAVLSQEKIEGGAMLVGDNSKVVQMVRSITDNCSDIKNHISPNTKVIDK